MIQKDVNMKTSQELKYLTEHLRDKLIKKNRELFEIEEQMNDILDIERRRQAKK